MARSYKKSPYCKDGNRIKRKDKRTAHKAFRGHRIDDEAFNDFFAGKSNRHRKYTCSWEICDYRSRWTKEDAIAAWKAEENGDGYTNGRYPEGWYHHYYGTLENFLNKSWRKWYRGK